MWQLLARLRCLFVLRMCDLSPCRFVRRGPFVCSQYAVEMEEKLDQLRSLVEAADRDKVELLNQLEEEKR